MATLGAFQLSSFLGEGGMGQVWYGEHQGSGVPVAIKILQPQVLDNEEYREAFETEVRSVASLDHPNIVTVLDYGVVDDDRPLVEGSPIIPGSPYLVMEYARGGAVSDYFKKLRWPDLRELLLVVLDALAHAHARDVIHRDLKPENILVGCGPEWAIKLTDFGLAHAADRYQDSGKTEQPWGTPQYMAPEQLRGLWREYGPWTDLYGLGCMAYELICGKWPFDGKTVWEIGQAHLKNPVPPLEPRFKVPDGLEEWLQAMLAKRRADRFQHAADAAYALRQLPALDDVQAFGVLFSPPKDDQAHVDMGGPELVSVATQIVPELRTGNVIDEAAFAVTEPQFKVSAEGVDTMLRPPLPWDWRRRDEGSISNELLGISLGLFGLRSIPMIDRDEERDRVWRILGEVHAKGVARQVVVEGSAGTGKSELVRWVCRRARELGGARILTAYHSPSPAAGDGLVPMMERFFRCSRLDREKLGIHLGKMLINEGLADQFDLRALMALFGASDEQVGREERFAIVYRVLSLLARHRPVVVWLDDVQWGLDAIGFAQYVQARQESYPAPILLLMTVRSEGLAERPTEGRALKALREAGGVEEVHLSPLSGEDIESLLRNLLRLDQKLAGHVQRRSQGVPLFAVQLVEDWVARRKLEMGAGGFQLREGADIAIPDDLHQLWENRIQGFLERRAPETLDYLELAAALGQEVDRGEWRRAQAEAALPVVQGLVERMVEDDLAERSEDGFHFAHGMLQESLERLAREGGRWPRWNQACAQALEGLYDGKTPGLSERVAWHWTEGQKPSRALGPLTRAVEESIGRSDYEHALDLIAWRETLVGQDPEWVFYNRLDRVRVAGRQGRYRDCGREASALARDAESLDFAGIAARARVWAGLGLRAQGELSRAEELVQRALEDLAKEPEAPRTSRAKALGLLEMGRIAEQRGDFVSAHRFFEAAREIFAGLSDPFGQAQCYNAIGDVLRASGDFDGAHKASIEALDLYRDLGSISGVADCLNDLAEWSRMQGALDEAREYAEESLRLYSAVGSEEEHFVRLNLAMVWLEQGQAEEARRVLKQLVNVFEDAGQAGLAAQAAAGWLAARAAVGTWEQWTELLAAIEQRFRTTGVRAPLANRALKLAAKLAEEAGRGAEAAGARELARSQEQGIRETGALRSVEPTE